MKSLGLDLNDRLWVYRLISDTSILLIWSRAQNRQVKGIFVKLKGTHLFILCRDLR